MPLEDTEESARSRQCVKRPGVVNDIAAISALSLVAQDQARRRRQE